MQWEYPIYSASIWIGAFFMSKKILIALPFGMLEQADYIAQFEHRSRSDLIRECIRRYINQFRKDSIAPSKISNNEYGQPFEDT